MIHNFKTVPFVLYGIFMACAIYIGLSAKGIPPLPAALALLFWVALPHAIGLYISIREGHNESAIIIGIFLGFWLYLGIGLLVVPIPDLQKGLIFVEPAIAILVFVLSSFYTSKDKSLRNILIGLGTTVAFLWVSKFLPTLHSLVPLVVGALGIWALVVMYKQLKKIPASA